MTLESGFAILEGLPKLENNYRMKVEVEAAQWLRKNHPEIRQKASRDYHLPEDAGVGGVRGP